MIEKCMSMIDASKGANLVGNLILCKSLVLSMYVNVAFVFGDYTVNIAQPLCFVEPRPFRHLCITDTPRCTN